MGNKQLQITFAGDASQLGAAFAKMSADAGKAGEEVQHKIGGAAKGIAAAIGAAGIGVALSAGITKTLDLEAANDKMAAQLGATGERAEDLGEVAGSLYANAYGDSVGQVNEAVKSVLQNIDEMNVASSAELESMTASVLDVATAFDQDLGGVTRAVGNLMRNGLAPDAKTALDIVTAGFQSGVNKSDDLLDTLNEYGTQFRKLGLDGQTATGLMSQGLQAGARDADTVADALKEFSIRAIDGSDAVKEGYEALGLSAKEMTATIAKGGPEASAGLGTVLDKLRSIEDPAERAQVAVALFGTKAEDLGDALFALDPSQAVGMLGEVAGAAERMGDTLNDNGKTRLEAFKRGMEENVTNVLGKAVGVLEALPGPLESFVQGSIGFAQMLVPLAPLATLLPTVASGLGLTATAHTAAGAAATVSAGGFWAAAAGIWATLAPILAVIAVIALIGGAVFLVVKHWDTIKEATGKAWTWVQDHIGIAVRVILAVLTGGLSEAVRWVVTNWDKIRATTGAVFTFVADKISGAVETARANVSTAINAIKGIFQGMEDKVRTVVNFINRNFEKLAFWRHSPSPMEEMAKATVDGVNRAWGGLDQPVVDPLMNDFDVLSAPGFGGGGRGFGGSSGGGAPTIQLVIDKRVIGEVVGESLRELLRANTTLAWT